MAINPFVRDTAYFRVARDRGMMINAEDLDLQFSKLIDFLNAKITSAVNRMVVGNIAGDDETPNTFLLNVGNGETKWSEITSGLITDNSVALNKLKNANPWSIIAANANRVFSEVRTGVAGQVLVSVTNDLPAWQLIKEGNIQDRSVTGSKLGNRVVNIEHLEPSIRLDGNANLLPDSSIITRYIQEQAVEFTQFKNGAITESKIDPAIMLARAQHFAQFNTISLFGDVVSSRHLANNLLTGYYFRDRSRNKGKLLGSSLAPNAIQTQHIDNSIVEARAILAINADNIANNTINGQWWVDGSKKLSERHLDQRIINALRGA